MTTSRKRLVIFGIEDYSKLVYEYFTRDEIYEVAAFTVDRKYIKRNVVNGLPVIDFEEIETCYPPDTHEFHAAVVYGNMNRDRAGIIARAEEKGYKTASYISPCAFVAPTVKIGKHCFIFENNVIQDFTEIGDNCILWSGNHIGHESKIEDNVFISSHVVVSGHCAIGSNCFLGVNSALANGTTVGKESWVSHGSVLSGDIPAHSMVSAATRSSVMALNEEALTKALGRAKR